MPEATLPAATETALSPSAVAGTDPPNPLAWADGGFVYAPPVTPLPLASSAVGGEPDVAVRARLNAFVLDCILLGVIVGPALVSAGVAIRSTTWLAVELAVQFAYFFVFEATAGQTPGKRVFHVRVVSLDGGPITVRQAAIRSVLRIVDALPLLYASGLISMIRTGRAKRQRIGDVVAGTVLVVDPGGRALRTPRWLLPILTLVATAISIALIVALLNAPQIGPPAGFTGDVSQPPAVGAWTATGTVTSSQGYGADPIGQPLVRSWSIARSCRTGRPCDYVMTRQVPGQAPERARLVLASDGWHGQLPTTLYVCGHTATGRAIYWPQVSVFVARFTDGGRTAEVNQRDLSYTPACGYGTHTVSWTATHS